MIGILDPALFLLRDEAEVKRDLDEINRICLRHDVALPPLCEYWDSLWREFGHSLSKAMGRDVRQALQTLIHRGRQSNLPIPALQVGLTGVWREGFDQLFGQPHLPSAWENRMAAALVRAAASGQDVILLTRRMPNRNMVRHTNGDCTLDENTRWILHLKLPGDLHFQVPCVYHSRNLVVRWTTRFDWRLPAAQDRARYPFCPPKDWWKPSTIATRPVWSKPAWVDAHGNGWARPNVNGGAGGHWDVYINSLALKQTIVVNPINIVEYAEPAKQKPGDIDHVCKKKNGRLNDVGWTCPVRQ